MSKGTEFVNRWMDAVKRGDGDALADMCDPDSVHKNPDGIYRGKEGVRELFKPLFEALSDREVQINNVIEAGDTLVVDFAFRGRHTGPFVTPAGPVAPTGKVLSSEMIAIYELRDGKLAGSRGMYDRLGLAAQLGLLPAPTQV